MSHIILSLWNENDNNEELLIYLFCTENIDELIQADPEKASAL